MHSKYLFRYTILFLICASSLLLSCKKDDSSDQDIDIYYKCRNNNIADDQTKTDIIFTASTDWYLEIAEADKKWISASVYAGASGSHTIQIYTTQNKSMDSRSATVLFHGDHNYSNCRIIQSGYTIIEFEDEKFEEYCIKNFDTDTSGYISTAEAHSAKEIICPNMGISSFQGIEHFINIEKGNFSGNNITTLSLNNCTALRTIDCSNNPSLSGLEIGDHLSKLESLMCYNCALNNLTIDSCLTMKTLDCHANSIHSLNFTNNTSLNDVNCLENYTLSTIFLNQGQKINNFKYEPTTRIVYPAEIINIPDAIFKDYLLENYDSNRDGEISVEEALVATAIRCYGYSVQICEIENLEGIEYFPNLEVLECSYCNIKKLDLSYNPKLTEIYCKYNEHLEEIKISAFSPLRIFDCSYCPSLETLSLNKNSNLKELHAENCNISSFDPSQCRSLETVYISNNKLPQIELSNNKGLVYIDCSYNEIAGTFSIRGCDSLAYIICDNNEITDFDIDDELLYDLECNNNKLQALDLSNCQRLHTVICDTNEIEHLYLPSYNRENLTTISFSCNNVDSLECSDCPNLLYLYANDNQLNSIEIDGNPKLDRIFLQNNKLEGEIDFSESIGITILRCNMNPDLKRIYLSNELEKLDLVVDETTDVVYK